MFLVAWTAPTILRDLSLTATAPQYCLNTMIDLNTDGQSLKKNTSVASSAFHQRPEPNGLVRVNSPMVSKTIV
jgi:hypothetical protein